METGFAKERQLYPFFYRQLYQSSQTDTVTEGPGAKWASLVAGQLGGVQACQRLTVVQIAELLPTQHETLDKSYHLCDNVLTPL